MRFEFHPITRNPTPILETRHPYIGVRVDSTDKTWIHHSHFQNWTKTATCSEWSGSNEDWIGLYPQDDSTCDFTKTITLPDNGLYRVEIMTSRGPGDAGTLQLSVDSTQIGNTMFPRSKMDNLKWRIEFPVSYFTKGAHSFKVHLVSNIFIAWIAIFKINRSQGGNQHINDSNTTRLDIDSGDFTQNNITDSNLLNLKLLMKEEFYDDNNPRSLLKFDYSDPITLWLGSEMRTAKAMFGGYVTDLSMDEDDNILTLSCEDRLFDLKRKPIYKNFKIGNPTVDTSSDTTAFTQFDDAYSMITALCECPELPLAAYQVPYDYGFKQTFSTLSEYSRVTSTVFRTEWDTKQGNPKPSLKVGLGEDTGDAETVLYQDDDGYDAYTYNYLSVDYFTGGAGSKYPLEFNFHVQMHKANETIDDAKIYTIHFNGPTDSNILTSVTPHFNGVWQAMTVDLKELFNTKAASNEYIVTKVSMTGAVTDDMLASKRCSAVWIDTVSAYKSVISTASYASQDVKTPFEELQDVCKATNLAAYVQYGSERSDDVLIVQPIGNNIIDENLEEGHNIIEINSWEYNPLDDDFVNQRYCTFNINDNETGSAYQEDHDSVLWYKPYQSYGHLDDINTQAAANSDAKNIITAGAWKYSGSEIVVDGCTLLEPSQYALVQVGSRHILGVQSLKSIKHEFSFSDSDTFYKTTINLNRPGDTFNTWIQNLKKDVRNSGSKLNTSRYTDNSLSNSGKSGLGVYTNLGG